MILDWFFFVIWEFDPGLGAGRDAMSRVRASTGGEGMVWGGRVGAFGVDGKDACDGKIMRDEEDEGNRLTLFWSGRILPTL